MHVDENPNLVEMFIAGENMKEFETYDDSKIVEDLMWTLEKFTKKTLKRPMKMTRTRWLTNENFLGSYSIPRSYKAPPGEKNSVQVLSEALFNFDNKPVVLFAGEATDEKYQGYVHGAARSGWRAAQEIIDLQ